MDNRIRGIFRPSAAIASAMAAAVMAGCSAGRNNTPHKADVEKSIAAIEGNPNIPTDTKTMLIAAIRQHTVQGEASHH